MPRLTAQRARVAALPLAVVLVAVTPAAAPAQEASPPGQETATVVVDEPGLRLQTFPGGRLQVAADGALLGELVHHLAEITRADFFVDPALLSMPVRLTTDPVGLGDLLDRLRSTLRANLVTSGDGTRVTRVYLSPSQNTVTALADAGGGAVGPGQGTTPTGQPAAPAPLPVPTGSETAALGTEGMSVQELIQQQNRARQAGTAGQPPGAAGAGPGAAGQGAGGAAGEEGAAPEAEAPASNVPPIPMSPDALESYFAGDSRNNVYHRLNCIQAMYLPPQNKVWFTSRQEAITAGYEPHEICIGRDH